MIRILDGAVALTANVKKNVADLADSPDELDAVSVKLCEPGVNAGNKAVQRNGADTPAAHVAEMTTPVSDESG